MQVDLSLISKFRNELMGIATIGIIVCHCPPNVVLMPKLIEYLCYLGKTGVALFFFLSGFGLYYSLSKNSNSIIHWYIKRYARIYIPYLLILLIPGLYFAINDPDTDWLRYLGKLSLISYWKYHDCAWFLAALLPFYAISPLLFKLVNYNGTILKSLFLLLVPFTLLPLLTTGNGVLNDALYDLTNGVAFVTGMFAASLAQKEKSVNIIWFVLMGAFYCCLFFFQNRNFSTWYTGLLFISLPFILYVLKKKNVHCSWLAFLGSISLESYLTNTIMPNYVRLIPWDEFSYNINYRNYLGYCLVIVGGLIWAFVVHKISKYLQLKLKL